MARGRNLAAGFGFWVVVHQEVVVSTEQNSPGAPLRG